MTARHALNQLKAEGLLVRHPGRGTFVAERATHRQASRLLSFSDEMRRLGAEPSSRVLEQRIRPARPDEAAELELAPGAEVVSLKRIRIAGGLAICVETAILRGEAAGALEGFDLARDSLHEALVRGGLVPMAGRGRLQAEPATARDAKLLGIGRGTPLLVERRLIVDQRRRPLELGETRYVANRYVLEIEFGVELAARRPAATAPSGRRGPRA